MVENHPEGNRSSHVFRGLELLKNNDFPTGPIALDCEMVGVGKNKRSALARVSIVDYTGGVLYDVISRPDEPITDFRTRYSGIRPIDMENALPFKSVQSDVQQIIENRVVVGHMIKNDFTALQLTHPPELVRDTGTSPLVSKLVNRNGKGPVGLKYLALELLGLEIQTGEHDSIVDAQTTLAIYQLVEDEWEAQYGPKCIPVTNEPTFESQSPLDETGKGCFTNCCRFC
nr:interferon stimulated 20 kDa exonuclease [Hymenolepis microstoma]